MAWKDREGWLTFVFLSNGKWENHHQKLGLKRFSCTSQFTIPDMAGMSPDPACNNTDTSSSQLNQPSRTPDFSYLLVSSALFWSLSPITLFLMYNSTIIAEHKVKSSLCISPCHDYELTPSTSISCIQHTPYTPSTQYCLSPIHPHDYVLTRECSFRFRCASLHDRPPSDRSPWELNGKVSLSHCLSCKLTNWWTMSAPGMPNWLPSSAGPNSQDYSLQVPTIMASKCISPKSLDHSL